MFSVDDSFQKQCMSFVSIHVTVTSVDVLSTKKGFAIMQILNDLARFTLVVLAGLEPAFKV